MEDQFGHFNLGPHTHDVPMSLHKENREKVVSLLEGTTSFDKAVVLLQGGKAKTRADTDHEPLFRQESYFHYLFGVKEPDFFGALVPATKKSILFIPRLPPSYAIFMGKVHPPEYFARVYDVDECHYDDEIVPVLKGLGCERVLILSGTNTDSGKTHKGASFPGLTENFTVDKTALFPALSKARVTKSAKEIEVMRYVCNASALAHKEVMKKTKAGAMEYQMESLFRHLSYSNNGARFLSYTCICGSGPNSAILHYGHAGAPNSRQIKSGEMLMFDMGAEYHCYGADISRSWPVDGKFTQAQREVYTAVYEAQEAVMKSMKHGVSWPSMHRLADRTICENLKKFGYLKGDIDEMMQAFIGSLFMPHGLGHLLGIDTHDVGGYPDGLLRSQEPGLRRLGTALEEGMIVTVEPGCYFIPFVLESAFQDPEKAKFLNEEKIRGMYSFGGVRIEDDVLVLKDGIENLSAACPRSIEDIEAWLAQ